MASAAGPLPGNDIFIARLKGVSSRCLHMEPIFTVMLDSFHQIEEERWMNEGPGWPDLAADTYDRKESGGYVDQMMVRTGELMESLTGDGGYNESIVTNDGWESLSTVPYAHWHQDGTSRMPARPLVDLNPAVLGLWAELILEYVVYGVAEQVDRTDIPVTGAQYSEYTNGGGGTVG